MRNRKEYNYCKAYILQIRPRFLQLLAPFTIHLCLAPFTIHLLLRRPDIILSDVQMNYCRIDTNKLTAYPFTSSAPEL